MKSYIQKMIREEQDLAGKIKNVASTLTNHNINLSDNERDLMRSQFNAMKEYLKCLRIRIALNENPPAKH